MDITNDLKEKYPFLSLVTYGNQEYVGVIQNHDDTVLTLYDISRCKTIQEKENYLQLMLVYIIQQVSVQGEVLNLIH